MHGCLVYFSLNYFRCFFHNRQWVMLLLNWQELATKLFGWSQISPLVCIPQDIQTSESLMSYLLYAGTLSILNFSLFLQFQCFLCLFFLRVLPSNPPWDILCVAQHFLFTSLLAFFVWLVFLFLFCFCKVGQYCWFIY